MKRIIIGLALVVSACGPQTVTDPTVPGTPDTTVTTTETTTTVPDSSDTTMPPDPGPGIPPNVSWQRHEWTVPEGVDAFAAAWGTPGMVVLGHKVLHRDDSPTPNGLWFFDGTVWSETLLGEATVADRYGFTPEVTDLVWFGDRFLAFLMGDPTTSPGRASMLVSADGIQWDLEYLGATPAAAALPVGLYATPDSPPWPGAASVAGVAVHNGELTAVGWTVLGDDVTSVPVVWRTRDGHTWSTTPLPNANYENEWASDVVAGPLGYLVEINGPVHQSAWLWYSPDGETWTYIGDRFEDEWRQLLSMAIGEQAMLTLMSDLDSPNQGLSLWRSVDGLTWQEVALPFQDPPLREGWRLADIGADRHGLIALVEDNGVLDVWRSSDGLTWKQLPSIELPAGDPAIHPFPVWPQSVVSGDRLTLIAPLPDRVVRWTEGSADTRAVVLVAADDVLNVRSGPGVEHDLVDTLSPTATGVSLTGAAATVGSSTWVEIEIDGGTGWVNEYYLTESAASFSDTALREATDELAAVFADRGDLTELAAGRGLFVAHHDRPRRFPVSDLDTLLTDSTVSMWAGTGCAPADCPDETPKKTFTDAVADSFLSAWQDEDRQVAVDEVLPGGNGNLPEAIVPTEFKNFRFVAVKDPGDNPEYGGLDWIGWYVYWEYQNGVPVVAGMSIDQWAP